ncbi:MAG: nitrogen regulation protein NR(II) [Candidatus Scalinduaceae bacterium]
MKAKNLDKPSYTNEYMDDLVENAGDGIIGISRDGTIMSMNRSAEDIFGYSRSEAIGQGIDIIVPQDKLVDEKQLLLGRVISNGEVISGFETERIRKDGKKVAVNVTISPIRNESGSVIGASGIFRTLTEEEFMRKRITQFDKLISVGKLAAELAHQVNSPLGAVVGRIQLILKNLDKFDKEMLRNNLKQMMTGCDHIRTAIGSLLDYSRRVAVRKPVDINTIIEDALIMMSTRLMLKRISVHKSLTKNLPEILEIGSELIHVFVSIMSNAIDAMDKGGRLEVITDVVKDPKNSSVSKVRITIMDTGHGISEQNIEKIFTPFYTTKEEGKGTGLGLSIVKRIIKMHKGDIDVLSKVDQGTSVILSFPGLIDDEEAI